MDRQRQRVTDLAFYYAYRAKSLILGEQLQTEQKLHQLEEFKEFTHLIRSTTEDVLNSLHVVYDSFEITGCWANIAAVNAGHRTHSHPNKERLSVSFNVMFPSYTETISAPKWKGNIEIDQNKA